MIFNGKVVSQNVQLEGHSTAHLVGNLVNQDGTIDKTQFAIVVSHPDPKFLTEQLPVDGAPVVVQFTKLVPLSPSQLANMAPQVNDQSVPK